MNILSALFNEAETLKYSVGNFSSPSCALCTLGSFGIDDPRLGEGICCHSFGSPLFFIKS